MTILVSILVTILVRAFKGVSVYAYCCPVAESCPSVCDPMDCSTPDFPVHHCLLEFAETHGH